MANEMFQRVKDRYSVEGESFVRAYCEAGAITRAEYKEITGTEYVERKPDEL